MKKGSKKLIGIFSVLFIVSLFSLSLVSAVWLGDFWNKITGKAIVATACPQGKVIFDETNEQIPSAGNIKDITIIKMQNQTFIKLLLRLEC